MYSRGFPISSPKGVSKRSKFNSSIPAFTPLHTEQGPETSHVESIELLDMSTVDCPSLTGILVGQGWQTR